MRNNSLHRLWALVGAFVVPIIIFFGILFYLLLRLTPFKGLSLFIIFFSILLGSVSLLKESYVKLKGKEFGLDYIALMALLVALLTKEYLVASVIALMLSTGRTLEEYGASQARQSLQKLAERIPQDVLLEGEDGHTKKVKVSHVKEGESIVIRKGEVIALDGILLSDKATLDESSLTGEAYPADKVQGDSIRSGTVNTGNIIRISVTKEEKNSSYNKILSLVLSAQKEKAPLIRLADRYSIWFTLVTLCITAFAFFFSHSLQTVLAVLVVATPCPLILATPIALIGGMNKLAKERIIAKKLASIEVLSRVNAIVFDKTGTITLGKPIVSEFEVMDKKIGRKKLLAVCSAIERSSLHPLARAIETFAALEKAPLLHAKDVHEEVGKGISATVSGGRYTLSKFPGDYGSSMKIGLYKEQTLLGVFSFVDELKEDSKTILEKLHSEGIKLSIFTGDKEKVAQKLVAKLGLPILLKAECRPEDKQKGIEELRRNGNTVAMVGDGINDAPALAFSDVGMVFSNEEQTAASEAADVVFLSGDLEAVLQALSNAQQTIGVAKQSIFFGIGASIFCMILAAFGLIPPIIGAGIQEGIDVAVILNALRASR